MSVTLPVRIAEAGTTVGPDGGTLALAQDQLQVEVPAGALDGRVMAMAEPVSVEESGVEEGVPGSGWRLAWADASGPVELPGEVEVSVAFAPDELPAGVFPLALRLFSVEEAGGAAGSPALLSGSGARLQGPDRVQGRLTGEEAAAGFVLAGLRPEPAFQVTAGAESVCSRGDDGQLWCWGKGESGALGDPDQEGSARPVPLPVEVRSTHLASGGGGGCTIREEGGVVCWGRAVPGAGPGGSGPTDVGDVPGARSLSVGQDHACAVGDGGSVWCWGSNDRGQLGSPGDAPDGPVEVELEAASIVEVAAGSGTTLAVTDDGRLLAWGQAVGADSSTGPATVTIRNEPPVAKSATGGGSACALDDEGSLWCWGRAEAGQLGASPDAGADGPVRPEEAVQVAFPDGTGPMTDVAMAPGGQTTCAVEDSGTLWCWGRNDTGQVGVTTDGRCRERGDEIHCQVTPVSLAGLPPVTSVALGNGHACAVSADNELWCWGSNTRGQMGTGEADDSVMGPVRAGTGR
ncbi:MAG: hypothetical protein EA352_12435 [Gemmatimonadales bacterium]|nr:MAG: hypothetical protein EA352_12435 [Gemmatimonadales bacterium]